MPNHSFSSIWVVCPAYNESTAIVSVIARLRQAGYDVVVVDDGLGVERPRPVVLGGALVVMATGSSSM